MIDPATLRQGDTVLIRAFVDHVRGTSIGINVGNSMAIVVPADIASVETQSPRQFRYRAAQIEKPLLLLAEWGDRLWLTTGTGEPITVPAAWVEEIAAGGQG